MPLPVIIPQVTIYGNVIKQWEVVTIKNTTLFVPNIEYKYVIADVDDHREEFLSDFLEIGNFLFEHFGDKYEPLLYTGLKIKHKAFEERITWSDLAIERLLDDSNFPFIYNNQAIILSVLKFISKYGYSTPRNHENEVVLMAQNKWSDWLKTELNIEHHSFQVVGASFVIYDILCAFISFCKPEYEHTKIVEHYSEVIYSQVECNITFSMHQTYNPSSKTFLTEYTVFSITDYLEMLLALINSGDLQQKINICPNCQKSFLAVNPNAVYCSSTCRNRANVRKSYYRKKGVSIPED